MTMRPPLHQGVTHTSVDLDMHRARAMEKVGVMHFHRAGRPSYVEHGRRKD